MTDREGLSLRLQFPPTPEFAPKHAQLAADAARDVCAVSLDYSPESLKQVDSIIGRFHAEGLTAQQMGETIFSFGCYVGEVFVRHYAGVWKIAGDANLPDALAEDNDMMVMVLPNKIVCNPIGKAFKLLAMGDGESLAFFYQVFTRESAGG